MGEITIYMLTTGEHDDYMVRGHYSTQFKAKKALGAIVRKNLSVLRDEHEGYFEMSDFELGGECTLNGFMPELYAKIEKIDVE